ncbi:hypothetical protein DH2020_004942 [Rehmannia glutinosa]|uniref:Thiol methyltransferase 2 n=1 Tax=Rehmannia glutinosa TaxID=99300 RepID=A0ABR0XQW3_REHGL
MRISLLPRYYSPAIQILAPFYQRIRFKNMTTEKPYEPTSRSPISANPKVNEFHQVFYSDSSTNGWDKCWEEGLTPWDLGSPTPVLVHLHNTGSLPKGRALVPGCGSVRVVLLAGLLVLELKYKGFSVWFSSVTEILCVLQGHDVVAIACAERHVVGLDISDNAIKKATELSSGSPNAEHFTFLKTDFFTWCPDELFDLIVDYTFFCAFEPELRSMWARKISDLLKPDGELIALMYPIDNHEGGPPYKVSIADYEEVLHPVGFKATYIVDNELAIAPRMGREKLGRWKRSVCQSSL